MRIERSLHCRLSVLLALCALAASAASPVIGPGGVVNAADYTHAFAPGGIISIFGTGLASNVALAADLPLPASLGGATVRAACPGESRTAPLFFVSPGQINAQLPVELSCTDIEITVSRDGLISNPMLIAVQTHAPRLFTISMDGEGQAVLLHADYRLVSTDDPAIPGDWVILYLTGMGVVEPPISSGQPGGDGSAAGPLSHIAAPVTAMVNGVHTEVGYAGLAPYFVGLYQINLRVPPKTRGGDAHLDLLMPDGDSQPGIRFPCAFGGVIIGSLPEESPNGTLTAEGISVAITGTATSAQRPITLHQGDLTVSLGDNALGTRFALRDLPGDFQGTIYIQLSAPPGPSNASQMQLVVEDEAGAVSLLPVRFNGNDVTATLSIGQHPAPAHTVSLKQSTFPSHMRGAAHRSMTLLFYLVDDLSSMLSGEGAMQLHWDRTIPSYDAERLASDLDNAYRALRSVGFDLKDLTETPVDVTLTRFLQLPRGEIAVLRRSALDGRPRISIRPSPPQTYGVERQPSDAQLAVRALCFLVQAQFDPLSQFPPVDQVNEWTWMHEAMSHWLMETANRTLQSPRLYTLDDVAAGVDFPMRGLQYPTDGQSASPRQVALHGAGAAPLLQYLRDTLGHTEWLRYLYITWSPTSSPAERLLAARNDLPELWRQFLMVLTSDGITYSPSWGDLPASQALFGYPHMPLLAPGGLDSNLKSIRWNAPNLSATPVAIHLENPAPEGLSFRVEYQSNLAEGGALLFGRRPSGYELLGVARPDRPFDLLARHEQLHGLSQVVALLVHPQANPPFTQTDQVELRAGYRAFSIAGRLQQADLVRVALYGQQHAAAKDPSSLHSSNDHIFTATVQAGINNGAIEWSGMTDAYTVTATEDQTFPHGAGASSTRIEIELSPSAERVAQATVHHQRTVIAHPGTQNETRTDQEWNIRLRQLRFTGTYTDPVFWFDPEPGNETATVESVSYTEKVDGVTTVSQSGVAWIQNPSARVTFDFVH